MYEVWNEENGNYFWDTGPNPAAYAQLYLATRAAIHGLDANAQVIIGGLIPTPQQGINANKFIAEMYQGVPGLKGNVHGVGLHPYGSSAVGVLGSVQTVRWVLDALGASTVPIEATEFGWETGNAGRERWRATMMRNVAAALARSNCGVGLLAPYDWETPPSLVFGGDWGLAGGSGLRPAGVAWFVGLKSMADRPAVTDCMTPAQVEKSLTQPQAHGATASSGTVAAAQAGSARKRRRNHRRSHRRARHHAHRSASHVS